MARRRRWARASAGAAVARARQPRFLTRAKRDHFISLMPSICLRARSAPLLPPSLPSPFRQRYSIIIFVLFRSDLRLFAVLIYVPLLLLRRPAAARPQAMIHSIGSDVVRRCACGSLRRKKVWRV